MSAVLEKKWSDSEEMTVILCSLNFRIYRAAVIPLIPLPMIAICIKLEFGEKNKLFLLR
jgi:hypothetical protein